MNHEKKILSPSSSSSSSPISLLKKDTESILSIPQGQFTSNQISQAIEIINTWLTTHESKEGIHNATKILQHIINETQIGNPRSFLNLNIIQKIMMKWIKIDPISCVSKIQDIVNHLHNVYDGEYFPYNLVIGVLTKCHRIDAAKYSTILLQQALDQSNKDFLVGRIGRNQKNSWGRGYNNRNNVQKSMTSAFVDNYHLHNNGNHTKADTVTFNSVISCWMNIATNEIRACDEVMRVLNIMKGSYRLGNINVKPNKLSFSMTMSTLLQSNHPLAALYAEEVLQDMIYFVTDDSGGHNNDDEKPSKDAFDNVLNALIKFNSNDDDNTRKEDNLKKAFHLVQQMYELNLKPDTLTYNSIIAMILTTKRNREAVEAIEEMIDVMKQKYSSGSNVNAKVDTISYNSLIKAYANNHDAKMAEKILRHMISESENGNLDVCPDIITWNSVLEAHAKRKSTKSVEASTRILHEMSQHDGIKPDKVTMSLMMIALTRSAHRGEKDAGKQALLILDRMEAKYEEGNELLKPDTFTYTQIIHCIARSGDPECYSMAMNVLGRMKELRLKGRENLKPDTATLNAVLLAIANSKGPDEAEKFLDSMDASSDPTTAPNAISFSTVISAWGKSVDKNRLDRVYTLLQRMERKNSNVKPNTVAYSTVLDVLAKSNDPTAIPRSMKILQDMEDHYIHDKSVRPNAYSYSAVMEAISNNPNRTSIASDAQELLSRMIKMATSIENDGASYTIVFNNAIKAIQKSSEKKKAKKVKTIFDLMKTLHESGKLSASPTVRTYNAILRCCAFTSGSALEKRDAFDIALDAFMELRNDKHISLDSYTYPAMFNACEKLLGKEKKDYEAVKLLFYFCTEDGLVSNLVFNNLKNYLPGDVFKSIVGSEKLHTLREEWGRNAPKQRKNTTNNS
jgi:pentatricopeptide repeat protein